jgi:hypothetical protein
MPSLPNDWHCRISGRSREAHLSGKRIIRHVEAFLACAACNSARHEAATRIACKRNAHRLCRRHPARTRWANPRWRHSGTRLADCTVPGTSSSEWHLLTRDVMKVRSHHEQIAAAPAIVPALSMLVPFAVALWMRVKRMQVPRQPSRREDV